MLQRTNSAMFTISLICLLVPACARDRGGGLVVVRQPWQMIESTPPPARRASPPAPPTVPVDADEPRVHVELRRPRRTDKRDPESGTEPPTATETVKNARHEATQRPDADTFINAVQVYDYEPGAVFEVIAAPGFVTVLRLRPGEGLLHLAAGDTSRWLIDTVDSGLADPQASLDDALFLESSSMPRSRISVLVKPRRPNIETNLVVATTERTYLLDLRSKEGSAYHSVIEWTYPRHPRNPRALPAARESGAPVRSHGRSDCATRNFVYAIKAPRHRKPPWTPVSVYDDGHRVHIVFPEGIDDRRRPPLFLADEDGAVRLVNYVVRGRSYIVQELFERAELRMAHGRVVIERVHPRSRNPICQLFGGPERSTAE